MANTNRIVCILHFSRHISCLRLGMLPWSAKATRAARTILKTASGQHSCSSSVFPPKLSCKLPAILGPANLPCYNTHTCKTPRHRPRYLTTLQTNHTRNNPTALSPCAYAAFGACGKLVDTCCVLHAYAHYTSENAKHAVWSIHTPDHTGHLSAHEMTHRMRKTGQIQCVTQQPHLHSGQY